MNKATKFSIPEGLTIAEKADWWVVRMDSCGGSAEVRAALDGWLGQDDAHIEAYEAARFLWAELDLVAESLHSSEDREPDLTGLDEALMPQRIPKLGLGGFFGSFLLAALLMIGALNSGEILQNIQADYRTAEGERLEIELPDGSMAMLGADTALSLDWSGETRQIKILRGEALFEVTPDKDRPFVVSTDTGSATALGTQYYVSSLDRKTDIYVKEGLVEVQAEDSGKKLQLKADQAAWLPPQGDVRPRTKFSRDRYLAWQEQRLVLHNRPISEVVDALDREYAGTILMLDLKTSETRLSGSFQTRDIPAALNAIALSLDADFQELPGGFLLLKI